MESPVVGARTYREIVSQPAVWQSVPSVLPNWRHIGTAFDPMPDSVLFTGCGSSYYLAQAAAAVFQTVAGALSSYSAVPASELLLYPELALPPGRSPLVVAISRSGVTSEVIAAVALARQRGLRVLSIVCDPMSKLAHQSDHVIAFPAAQEESMVMTRSFTTMLLGLQRVAGLLAGASGYIQDLDALPTAGARLTSAPAVGWPWRDLVVLGGGPLFGLAQEAAMKVREASLTPAIAYHPLEFRHGPMAVVGEQTLVLLLAGDRAREQEAALVRDIRALGARVLAIAERAEGLDADAVVELGSGLAENARQVLYMLPAHLLAYQRAVAKGIDPDAPRNLSKAVVLSDLPSTPVELRQPLP